MTRFSAVPNGRSQATINMTFLDTHTHTHNFRFTIFISDISDVVFFFALIILYLFTQVSPFLWRKEMEKAIKKEKIYLKMDLSDVFDH